MLVLGECWALGLEEQGCGKPPLPWVIGPVGQVPAWAPRQARYSLIPLSHPKFLCLKLGLPNVPIYPRGAQEGHSPMLSWKPAMFRMGSGCRGARPAPCREVAETQAGVRGPCMLGVRRCHDPKGVSA